MSILFTLVTTLRNLGGKNITFRRNAAGAHYARCVAQGDVFEAVGTSSETAAGALIDLLSGEDEPRCCSLCDAPGHGFPGGGPCPLEDRGYMDAFTEEGRREAWLEAEEAVMMEGASR